MKRLTREELAGLSRDGSPVLTDADVREMREMFAARDDLRVSDLAHAFGVTYERARQLIHGVGGSPRIEAGGPIAEPGESRRRRALNRVAADQAKAERRRTRRERTEAIVARLRTGESYESIANRFGVTTPWISEVAARHGIRRGKGFSPINDDRHRNRARIEAYYADPAAVEARNCAIRAAYLAGESPKSIAGQNGISLCHFYNIVRGLRRKAATR